MGLCYCCFVVVVVVVVVVLVVVVVVVAVVVVCFCSFVFCALPAVFNVVFRYTLVSVLVDVDVAAILAVAAILFCTVHEFKLSISFCHSQISATALVILYSIHFNVPVSPYVVIEYG